MSISALVLTLNEQANIERCLRALDWCDNVVVVDSFSQDRTLEIAKELGAETVQNAFADFASQRNFGLDSGLLAGDWILHLDADEVCTPELQKELERVCDENRYDAFRVPSKLMFMGKWIKHAGAYPTYQVRFGKREELRFKQIGHGQREIVDPSRIGTLAQAYEHYSFSKGLDDWIERHNRYSSDEARAMLDGSQLANVDWQGLFMRSQKQRRRLAVKTLFYQLPFRPLIRFIYLYFLRFGFLDGVAGLRYSQMLALYERMINLKLAECKSVGPQS